MFFGRPVGQILHWDLKAVGIVSIWSIEHQGVDLNVDNALLSNKCQKAYIIKAMVSFGLILSFILFSRGHLWSFLKPGCRFAFNSLSILSFL